MSIITDAVDLADYQRRSSQVTQGPTQYLFGGRPPTLDNINGGVNDGNRLQMAQALGAARQQGQSATSGNYLMGGVSPLQDAVRRSKALSASSIDQTSLSDEQRTMLTRMQQDPNVDYNSFTNAVGQLRSSQATQLKSQQFDEREQRISDRQKQNETERQNNTQFRQQMQLHSGVQKQIAAMEKDDPDLRDAPNLDEYAKGIKDPARHQAAVQKYVQYQQLKQQADTMQTQLGNAPAPATAPASAAAPKSNLRMKGNAIYTEEQQPNNIQIGPTGGQPQPRQQQQPRIATPDVVHQYFNRIGHNPDAVRQAMKADGWAIPGEAAPAQQAAPTPAPVAQNDFAFPGF